MSTNKCNVVDLGAWKNRKNYEQSLARFEMANSVRLMDTDGNENNSKNIMLDLDLRIKQSNVDSSLRPLKILKFNELLESAEIQIEAGSNKKINYFEYLLYRLFVICYQPVFVFLNYIYPSFFKN